MSPASRQPPPHNWPAIAAGALALLGIVAIFQNQGREEGQGQTSVTEMSRRMDEGFSLIRKDIERVNQLSLERAAERREEMMQRHTQQQGEIDEIKQQLREQETKR